MQDFLIRPLSSQEDAAAFRDIRLEGLQYHPEAFGADLEDERERSLEWFAERLNNNVIFGGFADTGALGGVIAVARGPGAKTRHNAMIWGMYVRPGFRGTGLSRQLLDAATGHAFEHCRIIRLTVVESNAAARRLYARAGFREWAVDEAVLKVGDVFYDEILMRIDRADSAGA